MTQTATRKPARKPRVVVDAALVDRIEALASGALARNPELADRLLDELGRAKVVPSARLPANVVTIGNPVTFRNETSGQEQTVRLVFPEDADIAKGRASVMTPIGVALLGLSEGAEFDWKALDGATHRLTVLRVGGGDDTPG